MTFQLQTKQKVHQKNQSNTYLFL